MRAKAILLAALLAVSMLAPAAMPAAADPEATGEVSISASPASDAQQFDYIINNKSSVDNFNVSLTGVKNSKTQTKTGAAPAGSSVDITVDGQESADVTLDLNGIEPPSYFDDTDVTFSGGTVTRIRDVPSGKLKYIETKVTSNKDVRVAFYINGTRYFDTSTSGQVFNKSASQFIGPEAKFKFKENYDNFPTFEYIHLTYESGTQLKVNSSNIQADGSKTVNVNNGESDTFSFTDFNGSAKYNLSWTERSYTENPQITVNGNSAGVTNTLSPGDSKDLSVNESWINEGLNNVSISTDSPNNGPASVVGLNYSHTASTSISTTAESTQFESTYNISHTYRNATSNATVLLPFDSGRVVEINNLEYRINGGSWDSLTDAEYTFDGSQITADISDAYGGELPEDSTVDVRSTGRKIEVRNGAVSVTDPTAPGDELDTRLSIDSKSDDFAINVGPTESGSRVHYGLSDDFGGSGPAGSAVIEANGDQHVEFPNALAGDSVRMNHLKTQVMPQSGDVRIAVEKAGSEPELDISPGPGGAGDPVKYRYYRTQTGNEYLLQSLTQGIILDSDVAESPAVFEDDDSDELLSILLDTGGDGGGGDSGVVGPIQSNTGMDIPLINDSFLSLLGLLVALGAGASLYFSGSEGFGTASRVGSSLGDRLRSSVPLVGGLLGTVTGLLGSLAASAGSGLASLARYLRRRPRLAAGLGGVLSLAGVVFGVIPLPTAAVFAVAVPLISFVLLREIGRFSFAVWAITSAIGLIVSLVTLGVDFGGLVNEQTSLILAVGGLYLAYQAIQIWRQGNINRIVLNRGD